MLDDYSVCVCVGGLQIGRLDLADCDMKLVVLKDIAPDPAAPIVSTAHALLHTLLLSIPG